MPLFDFHCEVCDTREEVLMNNQGRFVSCEACGTKMVQCFPGNQMIKMKGGGGYPSRQKQYRNTTKRFHPKLD